MKDTYACKVTRQGACRDASISIEAEGLEIREGGESSFLDFYAIKDFRLINYHLFLITEDGEIEVSMLGLNTEEFFDRLWLAYDAASREALFIKGNHIMDCEGDYSYKEEACERASKAKLSLFDDCVCILPHDKGARRVAFCFMDEPEIDGYRMTMKLDTGEIYEVARLGRETTPFFESLVRFRKASALSWEQKQNELLQNADARMGERRLSLQIFSETGAKTTFGLFSADPEDDTFWMAAIKDGRAAVELIIGESAATYLYEFSMDDEQFEQTLRHAMEAVGKYREVIYLEESELNKKPLYLMSVERSYYVRILRKLNSGKIAHTSLWEEKIRSFFK